MNAKFTQILSLLVGLLMLSASALYAQPANNECSGAIDISSLFDGNTNTSTLFDNTGATNEASDPAVANGAGCFAEGGVFNGGVIDNSVWFSFVGDGSTFQISSVECTATNYITNGDTQFALYTGGCGSLTPVINGCNEDAPTAMPGNFFAQINVETIAGTTYHLLVDGFADANGASTGEFCIEVAPTTINTGCDAGELTTIGAVQVMGTTETFDIAAENFSIPTAGVHWWLFLPGPDGAGGQFSGAPFASPTATGMDTFDATLNDPTDPPLTGTWEVFSYVTATGDINDECSRSDEFLTVLFDPTPPITECFAGTLTTTDTVIVDDMNPTFTITAIDRLVPNTPMNGGYSWSFIPGPDGTGSGPFSFGLIPTGNSTFTADLNGVLPNDLGGTWFIFGQTSTDGTSITTAAATVCDVTTDSLTVIFPTLDPGPCDAGSFVSNETQIVCVDGQFGLALEAGTDSIPLGGALGWLFDNTDTGGTGGVPGGTLLTNATSPAAFDNDLNGILSGAGFAPLEGAFVVRSVSYSSVADPGGSICSISTDSILVIFGEVVDLQILEDGNDLTAFPGPNFLDFTYLWNTGETTQTISPGGGNNFSVTATDGLGCETVAEFQLVNTNEADIVNNLSVAPNPTSGLLNIALDLPSSQEVQLSVLDITGKEIMNLAPVTFSNRNFEVDIQDQAEGIYLLRFRIGNDVVTRRVVKN